MAKKVCISFASGCMILIGTWLYLNCNYTISAEDGLYKKIALFKFRLFKTRPPVEADDFAFINVGKDPALIEDSSVLNYGQIAVTDRRKLVAFFDKIKQYNIQPRFIILDIEFYYPFVIANTDTSSAAPPTIDTVDNSLQSILNRISNITTPVLRNKSHDTLSPVIHSHYPSVAAYSTFGSAITKVELYHPESQLASMPLLLYKNLMHAAYETDSYGLWATDGGHLCLNYIWPDYYILPDRLESTDETPNHLGEICIMDSSVLKRRFENKVIFIGNFENDGGDIHSTPVGNMPGTLVLANAYLSLIYGRHIISYLWFFFMLLLYSILSYVSIYSKMPEINFRFKFIFSRHLSDFIKRYISYTGILLFATVICYFIFHIYVNVLVTALLFSLIEYIKQKKYNQK